MYIAHCTVYSVHYALMLYIVNDVCCVQSTTKFRVYIVHCTLYTVQRHHGGWILIQRRVNISKYKSTPGGSGQGVVVKRDGE